MASVAVLLNQGERAVAVINVNRSEPFREVITGLLPRNAEVIVVENVGVYGAPDRRESRGPKRTQRGRTVNGARIGSH
jgi:hypothetical protein